MKTSERNNRASNIPRDESSTAEFEADEWVQFLPNEENNLNAPPRDDLFGVVLVANWPPKESFTQPYRIHFLPKVTTYFDAEDLEWQGQHGNNKNNNATSRAVYLYPPHTLHITIATFMPFLTTSEINDRAAYAQACRSIIENAFARDDWPNQKFCIEMDRVHIGVKAGILLWKESDGGGVFGTMRKIIREEYDSFYKANNNNPAALNHRRDLTIPGIVHTTFMRFGRSPKTKRHLVQQRFEADAKVIKAYFRKTQVDSVRLVIERTPYMHIPNDERHVLSLFAAFY